MEDFIEVTYDMAWFTAGHDDIIRRNLRVALKPFGIRAEDGAGSDGITRDMSFTVPIGQSTDAVVTAAQAVMTDYGGSVRALRA